MKKEKTYIYGKIDYDLEGKEAENQLIAEEYKMKLKYGNGKIDKELKEKYEELKNRTKSVSNVRKVLYIQDAYLGRRSASKDLFSFIVVETKDGISLMYNITTGEDHSFDFNREIHIIEGTTKIVTLYKYKENEFQGKLDIGYMESIKLYQYAEFINVYTDNEYNPSYYIEFKDRKGTCFYVDVLFNKLYFRENCYELIVDDAVEIIDLYEYHKGHEVNPKVFKNRLIEFSKIFFEYE